VRRLVVAVLLILGLIQFSHLSHPLVAVVAEAMTARVLMVALVVVAATVAPEAQERAVAVTSLRQILHRAMTVVKDRLLRVTLMVVAVVVPEPLVKLLPETMAVTVVTA